MGLKKPSAAAAAPAEEETKPVKAEVVEPETDEVETEAEVQAPVPAQSQNVSPIHGGTQAVAMEGSFESNMAAEGFDGLEVGFYSYTTIKLPGEGVFQTAEDVELGKELFVNLLGSKPKWAYTNKVDEDKVKFSYDQQTTTDGDSLQEIFNEWKAEDDAGYTVKKYLDVTAMVVDGDLEGQIVILSVSPSGVAKFTGYMGQLTYKGLDAKQEITRVYVGPKVTKAKQPFYPWAFELYQPED